MSSVHVVSFPPSRPPAPHRMLSPDSMKGGTMCRRLMVFGQTLALLSLCGTAPQVLAQNRAFASGGEPPSLHSAAVARRELPPKVRIAGTVTDSRTSEPLRGVLVALEGTTVRATTRDDGKYELANVDSGSYTISARRLGYKLLTKQVSATAATTT